MEYTAYTPSATVDYQESIITHPGRGYALHAVVTSSVDMPKELFVFQRRVPPFGENVVVDKFVSVADPVDLQEMPVGTPDLANEMPYFRAATLDLQFSTSGELDEAKTGIAEDITGLMLALRQMAYTGAGTQQFTVIYTGNEQRDVQQDTN